ncbi:MAG: hypothetical protein WC657_09080, partial [Candidatus Paceibacterota bacterium]
MAMGFQDNPKNILGVNSTDNQFDSSDVVGNKDGSMIERIEYVQSALGTAVGADFSADIAAVKTVVDGLSSGAKLIFGDAAALTTASTTIIPITTLAGYGDDFFNNQFYLQVLHNANSAGNAPEKETRMITDYTSTGGVFTCSAFSQNVEASDTCLILHESQVIIGRNDVDNVFDSTNVTANATGSVLERMKYMQDSINTFDDFLDTEVAEIKLVTDA